jgi:hypothetical protein
MATINLNGQTFELDDEIAGDDQRLKDALAPYAPDIQHAQINRTTNGAKMVVNISKRTGTKGSGAAPLELLVAAPAWINPALSLAWQLKHQETQMPLSLLDWIEHYLVIEVARQEGGADVRAVTTTLERLHQSRPVPAPLRLPGL